MSRNSNPVVRHPRRAAAGRPAGILRPVRGRIAAMDEIASVVKIRSDRRQARQAWQKEDRKFEA